MLPSLPCLSALIELPELVHLIPFLAVATSGTQWMGNPGLSDVMWYKTVQTNEYSPLEDTQENHNFGSVQNYECTRF